MLLIALLAASVVGAPTPDPAPAGPAATPAAVPAPAAAAPVDDPLVCKQVQATGTRFSKKVCYRRSEMAEQQYRQRQALEAVQRSRNKMD